MNQLWLKEGLDLKIVTFTCMPTGEKRGCRQHFGVLGFTNCSYFYFFAVLCLLGLIEMVTEAETLRKIQIELGLTGSFKETPIADWLMKHNPSALEYERAVENFTG